jgi:uncharacterized SAM-binding protein YcdF (DUF218 family)
MISIPYLAMPAGLLWMAMLISATIAACRRHLGLAAGIAAALVAFTLIGSKPLGVRLMASLERGVPPEDPFSAPPFDALVALAGGTTNRFDGAPQLGLSGDRVVVAAELYLAGKAKLLVATGDAARDEVALWGRLGVPPQATEMLPDALDTRQEVAAIASAQARHGWRRIGLISSAYHLPRALRLCARQGLAVEAVGCDYHGNPVEWKAAEVVPQWQGFTDVQLACWEYLGRWCGQ